MFKKIELKKSRVVLSKVGFSLSILKEDILDLKY
jgi:hypothetical protein